MNESKTKNLTSGNPMKLIINFAFPLLIGFLFQQLYSMADAIIVGRTLGTDSFGAVGATGAVHFLIIGFCIGVCNGFVIPVAQKFGAGDIKALKKFVGNSLILSGIFSITMTIIVSFFAMDILKLMKFPPSYIQESYDYIIVIFIGIPIIYLYNLLSGYLRSVGDSKTPLIFLTIASVLNVILDLFFIIGLGSGVEGAAWATVISQAVSGILCVIYLFRNFPVLRVSSSDFKLEKKYVLILCNSGIPMGLQYSITAIGSVILQTAVNSLGPSSVAAVAAATKISIFFFCPFDALGVTMASYSGQNVGAMKLERVYDGLKSAAILGAVFSLFSFLILVFWGNDIALLFLDKGDTAILENVYKYNIINGSTYFLLALVNIVRFMIQGLGFSNFAIISGICEMIARAFAAFCLVPLIGYTGICLASPIAWVAADIFLIPGFFMVMKKLKKIRDTISTETLTV